MSDKAMMQIENVAVDGIQSMPIKTETQYYAIEHQSQALIEFVDALIAAMQTELLGSTVSSVVEDPKFRDTLLAYLSDEIIDRVTYTSTGKMSCSATDHSYHAVPSLVSLMLQQIGVVEAPQYGLYLMPKLMQKASVTLKPEERRAFLMKLRRIFDLTGIGYADQVVIDKAGEPRFAMMTLINDNIMAESSDAHPAYAVLATLVSLRATDYMTPRVDYGHVEVIKRVIRKSAMEAIRHGC